jgi:hypothetical protein
MTIVLKRAENKIGNFDSFKNFSLDETHLSILKSDQKPLKIKLPRHKVLSRKRVESLWYKANTVLLSTSLHILCLPFLYMCKKDIENYLLYRDKLSPDQIVELDALVQKSDAVKTFVANHLNENNLFRVKDLHYARKIMGIEKDFKKKQEDQLLLKNRLTQLKTTTLSTRNV